MKIISKKIRTLSIYTISTLIATRIIVLAGTLSPEATPSTPTMLTLGDLYNKLQNNTYSYNQKVSISTTTSPASSMYTLLDLYNAIPTISSSTIATGTTIMGITGNLTLPSIDQVQLGTTFGPDNSLTGTLSASIPALTWSAKASSNMNWTDALIYCNNLTTDGENWRMPDKVELDTALKASFYGNPNTIGFIPDTYYWSGTEYTNDTDNAYYGYYDSGSSYVYSSADYKTYSYSVRCVH